MELPYAGQLGGTREFIIAPATTTQKITSGLQLFGGHDDQSRSAQVAKCAYVWGVVCRHSVLIGSISETGVNGGGWPVVT